MKKLSTLFIASILVFLFSCKKDKKDQDVVAEEETTVEEVVETPAPKEKILTLQLEPKSDSNVNGNVIFKQENDAVTMVAVLNGLTEGKHAIHIHEKADCSSADGKSTGGHWNPTAQPHGKWGAETGYHKGDIGNFTASSEGKAKITFATDEWCIGCGDEAKDIIGKAVVVHQGIDDFTSQPSGAAGSRVSCSAIIE